MSDDKQLPVIKLPCPSIHCPPKLGYNGITIIMSNPSRFDILHKGKLLQGLAGDYVNNECLRPETNVFKCDVRTRTVTAPLLEGTKVVLLLGQEAMTQYAPTEFKKYTLQEQRGYALPDRTSGIFYIPTYLPQDTFDFIDYESRLNSYSHSTVKENEVGDIDAKYEDDEKIVLSENEHSKARHGRTQRVNWRFWMQQDFKKAIRITKGEHETNTNRINPEYIINPPLMDIIAALTIYKGNDFYFDMETDEALNMRCFAFNFGNSNRVYVVGILDYNYRFIYQNVAKILWALRIAIRDNCIVSHNGKSFDWWVLAWKYQIAVGQSTYDTMLAQHRIFPWPEKSLSHCVSLWTYLEFHKDEGVFCPKNRYQDEALLRYCGKDVWSMRLVKEAQVAYAAARKGMLESINQVNASSKPYLSIEFTGMRLDGEAWKSRIDTNDRLMMQYNRILRALLGEATVAHLINLNKTGKKLFALASSNKQACEYFHNLLGYKVMARSMKTRKPSLAKEAMYKLKLQYPDNPVIDFVLAFRRLQKETGSIQFNPMFTELGNSRELLELDKVEDKGDE
jgi:hypothetical protein